jgi:hypothetical protein
VIHDYLNFRQFDFSQFSPSLTSASSERILINLCSPGIPIPELKAMCKTKDDYYEKEIFFAFLEEPLTKKCRFFK